MGPAPKNADPVDTLFKLTKPIFKSQYLVKKKGTIHWEWQRGAAF